MSCRRCSVARPANRLRGRTKPKCSREVVPAIPVRNRPRRRANGITVPSSRSRSSGITAGMMLKPSQTRLFFPRREPSHELFRCSGKLQPSSQRRVRAHPVRRRDGAHGPWFHQVGYEHSSGPARPFRRPASPASARSSWRRAVASGREPRSVRITSAVAATNRRPIAVAGPPRSERECPAAAAVHSTARGPKNTVRND